jgi:phage shock protein C
MEQTNHHSARRLTRSAKDKVFGGICGGLALYLDIDPVLVRVLYVGLTLISGGAFGVILYLIAWIIIPLDSSAAGQTAAASVSRLSGRRMLGVLLIVVGAIVLMASALPFSWFFGDAQILGPLLLVAAGIALIMWKRDADSGKPVTESPAPAQTGEQTYAAPETDASYESEPAQPRRMYRLERDRKIAGVCSGLGEYFNIDSTIIRIFWIMLILIGGSGILLYLIMWLVMPLKVEPKVEITGEAQA